MVIRVKDLLSEDLKYHPVAKEATLVAAYEAVFTGRGSKEDADIVILDLLLASGFFQVTPMGTSDADTQRSEGGRAVFGHIMHKLNMPVEVAMAYMNALASDVADMAEEE